MKETQTLALPKAEKQVVAYLLVVKFFKHKLIVVLPSGVIPISLCCQFAASRCKLLTLLIVILLISISRTFQRSVL
jgi:hypothetical protein